MSFPPKSNVLIRLIICLALFACKKENLDKALNMSRLIAPLQTDIAYSSQEKAHYVVRNNQLHLNQLLLFIGGSYNIPESYNIFCQHAARIGFDVISLAYPNEVATAPLGTDSDIKIFDNYREEVCLGHPVSVVVSVNVLNSIQTRAIKLLLHLKNTYPNENWGQYLSPQNKLQWDKIILGGHSQGAGHACYLAKKNLAARVIMFAGPNDYHSYYNTSANWLKESGLTPLENHFALLHTRDEIVPFDHQVINLRGLGLLKNGQNPTWVDTLESPYTNARVLSVNTPAISFHSSIIGSNTRLPNIWTYLLTGN